MLTKTGRPRKYLTDEAIEAIADATAQIGFMPDRVRVARALVPVLAGLTEREPESVALLFRDCYVARIRYQWRAFGREWEENAALARIWGERYFSEIMGLKLDNPISPEVV